MLAVKMAPHLNQNSARKTTESQTTRDSSPGNDMNPAVFPGRRDLSAGIGHGIRIGNPAHRDNKRYARSGLGNRLNYLAGQVSAGSTGT
jgi:hypothetical protein